MAGGVSYPSMAINNYQECHGYSSSSGRKPTILWIPTNHTSFLSRLISEKKCNFKKIHGFLSRYLAHCSKTDLTLQAEQQASLNLPLKFPLQAEQQAWLNLPLNPLLQAEQQASLNLPLKVPLQSDSKLPPYLEEKVQLQINPEDFFSRHLNLLVDLRFVDLRSWTFVRGPLFVDLRSWTFVRGLLLVNSTSTLFVHSWRHIFVS